MRSVYEGDRRPSGHAGTGPSGPAGTRPGKRTIELPKITCPRCGMTSYNEDDIEYGYCGNCHDFTREPEDG